MKKAVFGAFLLLGLPLFCQAQFFSPGNVIFADPFYSPDGQIVELRVDYETDEAEIINVVKWEGLPEGANRRRALGLDVDPAGNVWVGITTTGDDVEEYPTGVGEALRIEPNGTQTFFPTDLTKATHLAAIGVNQVILNSNFADDENLAQLVDVTSGEAVLTSFNKTGHGEALRIPDGRILMGDNGVAGIQVYDIAGGDPTGVFYDDGRTVRSLTYNDEIGAVIALLQDQGTLLRISLDGVLEEEYDSGSEGFGNLWGIAQIPGTTNIIMGNHDVADSYNEMVIYNAVDFWDEPHFITITSGFENAGLAADFKFRSFFNMAVVPEETVNIQTWELF